MATTDAHRADPGIDPSASATPMTRTDMTLQLSVRTMAWLAKHPRAYELVGPVWDRLAELERAGHDPGVIAALRFVLIHHQPRTTTGRCLACRRWRGRLVRRHRTWPCVVWQQVHFELLGLSAGVLTTVNNHKRHKRMLRR